MKKTPKKLKTVPPRKSSAKIAASKRKPIRSVDPLVTAVSNTQYLYERFEQLYLHSRHARHSFAWLILFKKTRAPASTMIIPEADDEVPEPAQHWLHKPYPYSGFSRFVVVVASITCLSIVVQIMYPSGRTLPLSHLEGNGFVGLQTQSQIEQKIKSINESPVTVTTRNSSLNTSYSVMGVRANAENTFQELSHYPIEKRLIPFSIFFESVKPTRVSRDVNVEKLTSFTKSILTVTFKEPKNASVSMQGNRLVVAPSEDGYNYEQSSLQKQIAQISFKRQPVVLEPANIPAKISTHVAQTSIVDMQKRIDAGLTISAADQNIRLSSDAVASWIVIEEKIDFGTINLYFDRAKVESSLRPLVAAVDLTGVPEEITLLNGVEAGRKPGKPGRTLHFEDLVNQVTSATDWTVGLIQAKVENRPKTEKIMRSYSRDSTGFQSLLNYWASTNKGRFGIALQTQNGRIEASTNGHQLFSNTYKLYLPHLTYGRITTRALNPGSTTPTGSTIDGCIDKLVVSGHEACARALGELIRWSDNNALLAAQGLEDSSISPGGNGTTSAHDGAEWALKLLDGGITTLAQRSALISLMSEHNNRSGIPTGARGVAVANSTGQSANVRYDVGIVYHPRGTYVLSVFSEGSNFAAIANLTTEVNTIMGQ